MAFNEKLARKMTAQPKRIIDQHDLEAEREGSATRFFNRNEISPDATGRRLMKNQSKHDRGAAIAGCRRIANLTKDHAAAMARIVVPERKLAQV